MFTKTAAKIAIVSAILIAPMTQAHAYSIHVKKGVYTIECDNGVTSQGTTLQVSHAQAAYFCKIRGSSISLDGTGPGGAVKVPAAQSKGLMMR